MKLSTLVLGGAVLSAASASMAAVTIAPLSGFGTGGWVAPASGTYLQNDNLHRGMAYSATENLVYVVSRTNVDPSGIGPNQIRIFNPTTGADIGALNKGSGVISGGTFVMSTVGVGGDGAIYVANLTTNATSDPYKVYRWANSTATPTVAYSGTPLAGARIGDTFDVYGSGVNTLISGGYNSTPSVAGNNGYAMLSTTDGSSYTAVSVGFTGTPPNAGDHRLGLTFVNGSNMLGNQSAASTRLTSFSGTAGTLLGSPVLPFATGNARAMDYAVIDGLPILAIVDTGSSASTDAIPGTVYLYDMTNPLSPVYLASARAQTGNANANINATGAVAWGNISGATATLYALVTNNGLQAFQVTVPEPASLSLLGLGGLALLARRRA